jgi:sortase A
MTSRAGASVRRSLPKAYETPRTKRQMPAMPAQRRPTSPDQDATELLRHLIESPPPSSDGWKAPVALRSKDEQKRHALRGFRLRTWLDRVLGHAERLLAVAAVLVFGVWFVDGPVRDWMHSRSAAPPAALAAQDVPAPAPRQGRLPSSPTQAPLAPQPRVAGGAGAAAALAESVPLPYVTDQMASEVPELPSADGPPPAGPGQGAQPTIDSQLARKVVPQPSWLTIPAIGLDTGVREVFVVNGVWEVAEYAAGYLHGTALPGEGGNTALAGHAGLRGAVFRDLGALAPGDEVLLDAGGKRYRYAVRTSYAVWPTQVEVLEPGATPTLTMITCTNWDTQRLVVVADLLDTQPLGGP